MFEKYVNDKISEDKFYELDKSFDLEKVRLIKLVRDSKLKMTDFKNRAEDIDAFYELIKGYSEIAHLKREHITSLIDKVAIHEKKIDLKNV